MKVLDLFCGAGGLSLGFSRSGFSVVGVDIKEISGRIFEINSIGQFVLMDLSKDSISGNFDVIIGGPPCRPWSSLNTRKRERNHEEAKLLDRFFEHVAELKPAVFIMENVPPVANDGGLLEWIKKLQSHGYSICGKIIAYSEWGAATCRKRFFLAGVKRTIAEAMHLWEYINRHRSRPATVREAIYHLSDKSSGEIPDHEWPDLKTIDRYLHKYRSGKFGWYILEWDRPAPSFGNIMKTYILHPSSFKEGTPRVISVREAMAIKGFDMSFRFPEGTGLSSRYQMVADAVSPVFSRITARAVYYLLSGQCRQQENV